MEYIPRYSQPFTLQEARYLAVPIITEEISRLQNSLLHLQRTQEELKDALAATAPDDPDLLQAFQENKIVIGSQTERISMLRMVLTEKGISTGPHYDTPIPPLGRDQHDSAHPRSINQRDSSGRVENVEMTEESTHNRAGDGGIYL